MIKYYIWRDNFDDEFFHIGLSVKLVRSIEYAMTLEDATLKDLFAGVDQSAITTTPVELIGFDGIRLICYCS